MINDEPRRLVEDYLTEKGVTAWTREIGPTVKLLRDERIQFRNCGLHIEIEQPLGKMEEVILDHFRWLCQRQSWEMHLIGRRRVRMKDIYCGDLKRTVSDWDHTVLEVELLWVTPEEQRNEVYRFS